MHNRACQVKEHDIDYETEYAEYEVSKDSERMKKLGRMLKFLLFSVFIVLGKHSILGLFKHRWFQDL